MGTTLSGVSDDVGRTVGGGGLRLPTPEHGTTVYYDQAHYGPVSGGRAYTSSKSVQVVVGKGRGGRIGDMGSGLGSGTDGVGVGVGVGGWVGAETETY